MLIALHGLGLALHGQQALVARVGLECFVHQPQGGSDLAPCDEAFRVLHDGCQPPVAAKGLQHRGNTRVGRIQPLGPRQQAFGLVRPA